MAARVTIRHATPQDEAAILTLYDEAHMTMRESGNPTQWPLGYPGPEDVHDDLAHESLYVCCLDDAIAAVFFFAPGPDPTYAHIDGAWPNDEPYHVVHRIASRRGSGAGTLSIGWACRQVANLRIDTHEDNAPMRHVLGRLGFVECGTIICANGTPRVAYQHIGAATTDGPDTA